MKERATKSSTPPPAHGGSWWTRADYALLVTVAIFGFIVGWHFVTPYHSWGDDWAGYVLQARAIDASAISEEIARNGRLLRSGDKLLGPSAYPWGFPALLWLTGGAPGLSLALLKLVGVVSLAVAGAATFALGRFFMGRLPALIAVASGVLQPVLLLSVDDVLSDLPFLAIAMAALVVTVNQWRHGMLCGALRLELTAVIVVLTLLGYAVRSNGVVIPFVFGLAVLLLVYDGAVARARLMRIVVATAGCVVTLVVVYWTLLPDGSLYALSYLTGSPAVMAGRIRSFAGEATRFLPLAVSPRPLQLAGFGALLLLVAIAVREHRRIASIVIGYCLLHGLLLLVIDFNGSVRYLFPIVPPVAVLATAGAAQLLRRLPASSYFDTRSRAAAAGVLLAFVTLAQLGVAQAMSMGSAALNREYGPFSPSTEHAFRAAVAATRPGEQVAFFKPRAYRLLTGREAIVVAKPAGASRVPCHLLFLPSFDSAGRAQIAGNVLVRAGFSERYRNDQFALLCGRAE